MCLILFAWQAHPRYELVLAANRDEFHQRPTAGAEFWRDDPGILAGRDLQAGGTWMGVGKDGRFAALTNYREPQAPGTAAERSRGCLVKDYLGGDDLPLAAASRIQGAGQAYDGFNLLLGQPGQLVYVSNREKGVAGIEPGVHGLSNHLLDTDWPKVHAGRERLENLVSAEDFHADDLFDLMTDRGRIGGAWPGGVSHHLAPEELMHHYFIRSPVYGTRCTTVLLLQRDGTVRFEERRFAPDGSVSGVSVFEFEVRQDGLQEISP